MDIRGFQCRFLSVVTPPEEGWIFYDFHYRFSTVVTPPEEGGYLWLSLHILVVARIDQIMELDLQQNLIITITNEYKKVDYFYTFLING